MQKYFNSVTNSRGDAILGARVAVSLANGSLATIYSDNGVTTQPNPITTDGNGYFAFYAADGRYDLRITAVGIKPVIQNDILLEDIGEQLTDFEERVYPGVYESPPTTRPSGAVCVEGDRCTIMVAGIGYEHLRSGGVWVIPNIDATTLALATGSTGVGFIQSGVGAVARTVAAKAGDILSAADFGVLSDGSTDDTAALKTLFDFAIPRGLCVTLKGTSKVSGPIASTSTLAAGSLHIHCDGNVQLLVDAGATAFRDFLYCASTAANNSSISGGSLTIDLNNRGACGITTRHNSATRSGIVNWAAQVSVLNCRVNDASATYENQGILVFGDYERTVLNQPYVAGVSRLNTSGGACKGITIAGFTGVVTLNQPSVKNVFVPIAGNTDADGIAVFSKATGSTYNARLGKVSINDPIFEDCQGRSFKAQCSDVTVYRPKVKRQMAVAIADASEFEFQFGNGLVIEPDLEYRMSGGVSPIGASHSIVAFQQVLDNAVMRGKMIGGTLRTEVAVPRCALVVHQATALQSETEVSGLRVIPIGALATTAFSRAIMECDASTMAAKSSKTKLTVRDIAGPLQCYAIGYTGYVSGGSLATTLTVETASIKNSLAPSGVTVPFKNLSGAQVNDIESLLVQDNQGFRDLLPPGWVLAFNKMQPGSKVTVDITTIVATGAPGWGVGTPPDRYATVECVGAWFGATEKTIRVTKGNATAVGSVFWTQDGGTTWGQIK